LNDCPRPLEPLDCEALACGEAPVSAGDATSHAAGCPSCGSAVDRARVFLAELEGTPGSPAGSSGALEARLPAPASAVSGIRSADLASRIIRLRPFSRRERRDLRLWAAPAGFAGILFAAGFGILAAPGFGAREQVGLAMAALAPLAGLSRAVLRALAEAAASAPSGWQALADAARRDAPLGFAALLLLAPAGFALRRVLARAGRRG
jgi:hypothetical protein